MIKIIKSLKDKYTTISKFLYNNLGLDLSICLLSFVIGFTVLSIVSPIGIK